jgi:hypothetical protein
LHHPDCIIGRGPDRKSRARAFSFSSASRAVLKFSQAKIFFKIYFEKYAATVGIDQKRANQ